MSLTCMKTNVFRRKVSFPFKQNISVHLMRIIWYQLNHWVKDTVLNCVCTRCRVRTTVNRDEHRPYGLRAARKQCCLWGILLLPLTCINAVVLQTVPGTHGRCELHRHISRRHKTVDWRSGQYRAFMGFAWGTPVAATRLCITDILTRLLPHWRVARCRVR